MPFYYTFLMGIAACVTMADFYLYEYKFWWFQGAAMALMVCITMCVFGCDRVRTSKRESLTKVGYEPAEIKGDDPVRVLRNGVESEITNSELTVGDMIRLVAGDIIPADCAIFYS